MTIASGTQLGRYEIQVPLGAGGPASVRGMTCKLRRGRAEAKKERPS